MVHPTDESHPMSPEEAQRQCLGEIARRAILAQDRHAEAARLVRHGAKCFSQGDEDGIIAEIFRRIGPRHRTFVEFGAGNGLENNTAHLLLQGWRGAWIDGDPANVEIIRGKYRHYLEAGRLVAAETLLLPDNVDRAVASLGVTGAIDLLSVDVDGNDLALIEALECVRPRVVVAEYNARYGASVRWRMPFDAGHRWDGTEHFGASLAELADVMDRRGFALVGCNLVGTNAFFVARDEDLAAFRAPFTAEEHFEPARYYLLPWHGGHPVDARADRPFPLVAVAGA